MLAPSHSQFSDKIAHTEAATLGLSNIFLKKMAPVACYVTGDQVPLPEGKYVQGVQPQEVVHIVMTC